MKKTILALACCFAFTGTAIVAQAQNTPATTQGTKDDGASLEFQQKTHDFGNLQEGDDATAEFTFTNTGNEPIIIQNVRPSCGCTTPYWSKEPIAPGKKGTIKASYGTKGRPGAFNKSITVTSNAGREILYIKGDVHRSAENSAPENTSMMKK